MSKTCGCLWSSPGSQLIEIVATQLTVGLLTATSGIGRAFLISVDPLTLPCCPTLFSIPDTNFPGGQRKTALNRHFYALSDRRDQQGSPSVTPVRTAGDKPNGKGGVASAADVVAPAGERSG